MYYRNMNGRAPVHIGYFEPDPKLKLGGKIITVHRCFVKKKNKKKKLTFCFAVYFFHCIIK